MERGNKFANVLNWFSLRGGRRETKAKQSRYGLVGNSFYSCICCEAPTQASNPAIALVLLTSEPFAQSQSHPHVSHRSLGFHCCELQLPVQWAEFMRNAFSTCSFRSGLNSCCRLVLHCIPCPFRLLYYSTATVQPWTVSLWLLSVKQTFLFLLRKPVSTSNQDKVPLFLLLNC